MIKDVTKEMEFNVYDIDSESLPITQCLCGTRFRTWDFHISIYSDMAHTCPECGRKFYFEHSGIKIYQVED